MHPASRFLAVTAAAALWSATPAVAQSAASSGISAEVTTDLRERGISWSDGKAAAVIDGTLALTSDLSLQASARTLRGSPRHGDSTAGFDIGPRLSTWAGGWELSGGVTARLFTGHGKLNYVEIDATAERMLGPAWLAVGADFAPSQAAIGSTGNLHLRADAGISLPGTPLSLSAGGGYTLGGSTADPRSARLRPRGDYGDYQVSIEASQRNLGLGLRFTDTFGGDTGDYPALAGHDGARVAAYARLFL